MKTDKAREILENLIYNCIQNFTSADPLKKGKSPEDIDLVLTSLYEIVMEKKFEIRSEYDEGYNFAVQDIADLFKGGK